MIKSICTCIHVIIFGLVHYSVEVEVQPTLHNTVLEYGNLLLWGGGGLAVKHINQLLYLFFKFLCLVTGQLALFQITASILLWIF